MHFCVYSFVSFHVHLYFISFLNVCERHLFFFCRNSQIHEFLPCTMPVEIKSWPVALLHKLKLKSYKGNYLPCTLRISVLVAFSSKWVLGLRIKRLLLFGTSKFSSVLYDCRTIFAMSLGATCSPLTQAALQEENRAPHKSQKTHAVLLSN